MFSLKAPQQITHFRRLRDCREPVGQLLAAAKVLKKGLGPLLFQLPPNFKKNVPRLREFLRLLPKRTRAAFEFRHASWFDEEVFELLRKSGVALCYAEEEESVEVPFVATADWGYLRLRLAEYSGADLRRWIRRVREQKWSDAFVFFKHEDEGKGASICEAIHRTGGTYTALGEQRFHHFSVNVGQPEPPALEFEGQALVVDAEEA